VAVCGKGLAPLAERPHLLRRHRFEACVTQRSVCGHDAVQDRLAVTSQALHAQSRDATELNLRQHLLLEAAIRPIKTIERHLDRIRTENCAQAF